MCIVFNVLLVYSLQGCNSFVRIRGVLYIVFLPVNFHTTNFIILQGRSNKNKNALPLKTSFYVYKGQQVNTCHNRCKILTLGKVGATVNGSNAKATFVQSTRTQIFFENHLKPCHVGIHWIALAKYSQMSTHIPGFRSFFRFFASFCIGQISHQQH